MEICINFRIDVLKIEILPSKTSLANCAKQNQCATKNDLLNSLFSTQFNVEDSIIAAMRFGQGEEPRWEPTLTL